MRHYLGEYLTPEYYHSFWSNNTCLSVFWLEHVLVNEQWGTCEIA